MKGETKMEMHVKERVHQALKRKNYFEYTKKDSLEVFEKAEHLEDLIIQVERYCNVDKLLFRYNPATRNFHRITLTADDKELLRRESQYKVHHKCIQRQCFKKEINVDSFIVLLDGVFEPIAVYHVS